MIENDRLFIDGGWVAALDPDPVDVRSPSTEELVGHAVLGGPADIDSAVAAARSAFDDPTGWASWSPTARSEVLERFADELTSRAEDIAHRVAVQNGMPIGIARQVEATVPATLLRYYAGIAARTEVEEVRQSLVRGATAVRRDPVGVVAAIVPWNFPQILTFFKVAPALATGCTVVLKPAPETTLDACLVAEAAAAAGLPAGVLNVVPGDGPRTGMHLVTHPLVDKVAFTGSTAAGRAIGEACGRLLRPVTLELGGKSAGILLDDVDLGAVMQRIFPYTMLNQGQSCYLSTRILAPRSRYEEVVGAFTALARSLPVGDALDDATAIGPLVSERQRQRVERYIEVGLAEGARLTTGGGRPRGMDRGWFIEPTIFADVENHHTVACEEIFGPVLTVIPFEGEEDAVRIANDSEYGLAGTVWTSDVERGAAVARRMQTGSVGINGFTLDHGSPFGGVKSSGLGRELGPEALAAYQQLKSIYLPR